MTKKLILKPFSTETSKKAQEKQKEQYDRKHAQPKAFLVGEKVLKKDFRRKKKAGGKMDAHYAGPFIITKSLGKGFYALQGVGKPSECVARVVVLTSNLSDTKMPYGVLQLYTETFGDREDVSYAFLLIER